MPRPIWLKVASYLQREVNMANTYLVNRPSKKIYIKHETNKQTNEQRIKEITSVCNRFDSISIRPVF